MKLLKKRHRVKEFSSHFLVFCKKTILTDFTKFTGKQLYRSLFFDKVLGLKFKMQNALYSLHRPQPQNVTLDLGYSLMINNKQFQSKYCESLRVRINIIEFVKLTHSP